MVRNRSGRIVAGWSLVLLAAIWGRTGISFGADLGRIAATRLVFDAGSGAAEPPAESPPETADSQTGTPGPEEPIPLTLQEAVRLALERNRDIQIASFNPRKAREELKSREAVYDPALFSGYTATRTDRPIQSQLDTGSTFDSALIEDRWSVQLGLKKAFSFGGALTLFQEADRLVSNSSLVFPNPQSTSRVTGQLTQPLLKGFGGKENRSAIRIASLNVDISEQEFRQRVLDVASEVARTYWQLVFDREMVKISRRILDMAEEVLRREVARQERGISRPLDVNRARATAESRRSDLLKSLNRQRVTSEQLMYLTNSSSLFFPAELELVPVDSPRTEVEEVDRARVIETARKNRPEIARAQKAVRVARVQKDLAGNNRLPKLDVKANYSMNGLGRNFGETVDDAYNTDRNSWAVGLEFEWPIAGRASAAAYRKAAWEEEQMLVEADRILEQIQVEVDLALDEVRLARKEIPSSLQARRSAEQVVNGEHARFELGQTTNEELLRAQDFLGSTEREYMRAVIDYNISLARLGRAQGTLLADMGFQVGN